MMKSKEWVTLERISKFDLRRNTLDYAVYLAKRTLKEGEAEINNCDGCQSNTTLSGSYHLDKDGVPYMICQKSRYQRKEESELRSFEEVKESIKDDCDTLGETKALAEKEYPTVNDREKVWGDDIVTDLNVGKRLAFIKGHTVGYNKALEEVEKWAYDEHTACRISENQIDRLLTKLQILKQIK